MLTMKLLRYISYSLTVILMMLLVAACQERLGLEDLPTPISDIDAAATAIEQTQNAPPEGFSELALPQIDIGLDQLNGWQYEAQLIFDGVFSRTPRTAHIETNVQVEYNRLASARRVLINTSGGLLGTEGQTKLEGVRLGPDVFLLIDDICQTETTAMGEAVADLTAGGLIGGVQRATASGDPPSVINGQQVWRYAFDPTELVFPNIRPLADGGKIIYISGELWYAPEHEAVIRFWLNLDVENVVIFGGESQLPVSGSVIIRYDVFDIGQAPNLSIPFGC